MACLSATMTQTFLHNSKADRPSWAEIVALVEIESVGKIKQGRNYTARAKVLRLDRGPVGTKAVTIWATIHSSCTIPVRRGARGLLVGDLERAVAYPLVYPYEPGMEPVR